jgi:hypothetical protein
MRFTFAATFLTICCWLIATVAAAPRRPAPGGPGTVVRLPYTANDNAGQQWMIYPGGWFRQQGNMPLYSQAGMITVNGNQPQANNNQARMDDKTGEIIFDEANAGGVMVSRHILINKTNSYVRYIDVLRNPTPQDQSVNVQFNTNFNYGVQSSQTVEDPKKKDRQIAWVGQMQVGRAIVEMFGSKNAKAVPQINAPPESSMVQATMQVTVPGGKAVAILHLHAIAATSDAGAQLVTSMKSSQLLADVPLELRKEIINVAASQSIGEREVLRGEMFDVIELRGGEDQLKGTITEKSYQLQTFYGPIELPAERVVGLINVGQFRPRQLLVTVDGEVFGGTLSKDTIGMQLSSGQTTQVPLSQISRFGYRKRTGEPEEWNFDRPMIVLRSGERMNVAMPSQPIDVMTRYGTLKLKPETIASLLFQSEEHGVHEIILTDGSKFAGLVSGDHFEAQLVGTSAGQKVSFPAATIAKIQFTNKSADELEADDAPTLALSNQDTLVGTLAGQLKLDTTFDTITIDAAGLRAMTRAPEAGLDVQVTLWDQTTISGQLEEPEVTCDLKSGVSVKIPVPLIDRYSNPSPRPSPSMIDRIKSVVADLSADDWKQRERAEAQLVSMGPVVASVLKDLSASQPPEAQQRIDSVLKQLEKQAKSGGATPAGTPDQ